MRPKSIASLFLTPRCDMSCRFCASERDFDEMAFEQAVELFRTLRQDGYRSVVLGGGEPFLWEPGVARAGLEARRVGLDVQVCTNGIAVPDRFERLDGIDRFLLPLESMDAERHDRLRRWRPGHHRVVLQRIAALRGAAAELTVSTVVTRENVGDLPEIASFLEARRRAGVRLHAWHLYRFLPVGRQGARHADELDLDGPTYRRACRSVRSLLPETPVYRRDNMLRSSTVEFFWYERGRLRIGSRDFAGVSSGPGGAG